MPPRRTFKIGPHATPRGASRDIRLKVSESYAGIAIEMPLRVQRAQKPGPTVFVTAAVHGDEINGTGIIHQILFDDPLPLTRGTLVLVPVVNVFGFETLSRYMPDRRDLNRSFPGSATGSLTSRAARLLLDQVITRCDFGIDLHSAAAQRTNYPNVRGDLANPAVRRLARAFGCELMVHGKGPEGSLRREACKAGVPTVILEAGEPFKMEPGVIELGVRGVRNVLVDLGMIDGEPTRPAYQSRVNQTTWVRASVGGILRFHVAPGQIVEAGQPLATNTSVFGREKNVLTSPLDGVVLGMTTLPTVKPGEPVCHIAVPSRSIASVRQALAGAGRRSLHRRVRSDLARNVLVTPAEPTPEAPASPGGEAGPDSAREQDPPAPADRP